MGLFQYKKPARRGDPEAPEDKLGNGQFLKKAIGKQQKPLPLSGRRRQRKASDASDESSSLDIAEQQPAVIAVDPNNEHLVP